MTGSLFQYLESDHKRIDEWLQRAASDPDKTDMTSYSQFRAGLLRHIGIEERLLFPPLLRARDGKPLPIMAQIKLDHAAIVALLVPPPTQSIITAMRVILDKHNMLEEEDGGLYQVIEQLPPGDLSVLLEKARSAPEVPMVPHKTNPEILEATRRVLARAGYNLADYETNGG